MVWLKLLMHSLLEKLHEVRSEFTDETSNTRHGIWVARFATTFLAVAMSFVFWLCLKQEKSIFLGAVRSDNILSYWIETIVLGALALLLLYLAIRAWTVLRYTGPGSLEEND